MNNTSNGTIEREYLIGDLLPIGFSFLVGFIFLVIFGVSGCCGLCKNNGNSLIIWLYGGRLTKVEVVEQEEVLYIDGNVVGETFKLNCLRSFLLVNAITLVTLLAMIFWDSFFVKSDFDLGCLANYDCYIANKNYSKLPLNCSQIFNQDEKIVCYQFKLDFFQAFADTGGVLTAATLGVWVMTKIWICGCVKNKCFHICVALEICKYVVLVLLIGGVTVVLILIHKHTHESYSWLRDIGHVLKFVAVGFSIIITTVTPWCLLKPLPPCTCSCRIRRRRTKERTKLLTN